MPKLVLLVISFVSHAYALDYDRFFSLDPKSQIKIIKSWQAGFDEYESFLQKKQIQLGVTETEYHLFPVAHALAIGDLCFIGGFPSTVHQRPNGGGLSCQMSGYTPHGIQKTCASGQAPCNPAIFGFRDFDTRQVHCVPISANLSRTCARQLPIAKVQEQLVKLRESKDGQKIYNDLILPTNLCEISGNESIANWSNQIVEMSNQNSVLLSLLSPSKSTRQIVTSQIASMVGRFSEQNFNTDTCRFIRQRLDQVTQLVKDGEHQRERPNEGRFMCAVYNEKANRFLPGGTVTVQQTNDLISIWIRSGGHLQKMYEFPKNEISRTGRPSVLVGEVKIPRDGPSPEQTIGVSIETGCSQLNANGSNTCKITFERASRTNIPTSISTPSTIVKDNGCPVEKTTPKTPPAPNPSAEAEAES